MADPEFNPVYTSQEEIEFVLAQRRRRRLTIAGVLFVFVLIPIGGWIAWADAASRR